MRSGRRYDAERVRVHVAPARVVLVDGSASEIAHPEEGVRVGRDLLRVQHDDGLRGGSGGPAGQARLARPGSPEDRAPLAARLALRPLFTWGPGSPCGPCGPTAPTVTSIFTRRES